MNPLSYGGTCYSKNVLQSVPLFSKAHSNSQTLEHIILPTDGIKTHFATQAHSQTQYISLCSNRRLDRQPLSFTPCLNLSLSHYLTHPLPHLSFHTLTFSLSNSLTFFLAHTYFNDSLSLSLSHFPSFLLTHTSMILSHSLTFFLSCSIILQ